jgi:hypothetical protein
MKELEVKSMLADPNIPDEYKLGGRLDSRFLDGVEYAERAMEKAEEFWVARDKNLCLALFKGKPIRRLDHFSIGQDGGFGVELPMFSFPDLTFEKSPIKVKLIQVDE